MIAIAFILAVAGVLASAEEPKTDFDFNAPGFWRRQYQIPDYYGRYVVDLIPKKGVSGEAAVDKVLDKYGGKKVACPPVHFVSSPAADTRAVALRGCWTVPSQKGSSAGDAVLKLGTIILYHVVDEKGIGGDSMREMEFKFSRLSEEKRQIGGASEGIPGILGLLDAQLENLQGLMDANRRASANTLFQITLRAP